MMGTAFLTKGKNFHKHKVADVTDLTVSATELNYVDGVTSNVQTQLDGKAPATHNHTASQITDLSKSSVGLGNVDNKSSATIRSEITSSNVTTALGYTPMNSNLKGANSGVAELDANGKVPTAQLPSYVDDVLEYSAKSSFPTTGESGKIYVDTSNNKTYRWSGSAYVEISASLALGETSSTAYRGDRGKTAYDHSQVKDGSNPHATTFTNIASKPTTISGYGITDAKIANGVITLGSSTITPLTSSSSLNASNLSSGTVPSARLPIATSSAVGGVKSGTDITVDSSGNVSVNDNSHNHNASNITAGTLSSDRLPTVPIAKGGTGATTASGALTNLGITATATELNYVDGVTSNIQTQLNAKAVKKTFTATIPTTGWTATAPFYVDVTVTGILEADAPAITPTYSGTLATDQAIKESWSKIDRIVTYANKIRVYAFDEVPTTAVPISIQTVR